MSKISYFTRWQKELTEIHHVLTNGDGRHTVVLHGMGGIGKAQMTIEYARRHQKHYSAIFWLNSKDEDSLKQSFRRAGQRIFQEQPSAVGLAAVSEDGSLEAVVNAVKGWFDQKGNTGWLLVYDNYDNPKLRDSGDAAVVDIKEYLPDVDHGSVIITTRLSQVAVGHRIGVRKLPNTEDGLYILTQTSNRADCVEDRDARKIAARLDGLPLALATAGAYLREVGTSFAQYLEQYEASWLKLQQTTPSLDAYDRALYSTWQLSYTHIEQQNALSTQLLRLWAYFDNQDLWYELLREGVRDSDGVAWFSALVEDELTFTVAARVICQHGLIEVDTSGEEGDLESRGYSMHPCVHAWTMHVLNQERDGRLVRLASEAVARHVPEGGSHGSWITQRRLMQHTARCWSLVENAWVGNEDMAWTWHSFSSLYRAQGKLDKAEEMCVRALQGKEHALGPTHTSTLDTVNNVGDLYRGQGRSDDLQKPKLRFEQKIDSNGSN